MTTCWVGESAVSTSSPMRLFLDGFDELLDDAEMDVGLEQRHADLAQRGVHVFGRQFPFAAQVFENPLQLVG